MKTIFDLVSQEALPLVRAMTTRSLLDNGFSQKQIADKLGLTQPAISQYKNKLRGRSGVFSEHPEGYEELNKISKRIASGEMNMDQATMDIFGVCKKISESF